jgi:tetratricopeptide (TPR) repeat protein
MAADDFTTELSEAWGYHRAGRNDEAHKTFDRILSRQPDQVDALFGIGLVQRVLGMKDKSIESFDRCRKVAQKELDADPGADRYLMLLKMIQQRIHEVETDSLISS